MRNRRIISGSMTFAIILSLFISGNTAGIIDNNKLYEVMLDESAGSNLMFSDKRSNLNTSIKSILNKKVIKKESVLYNDCNDIAHINYETNEFNIFNMIMTPNLPRAPNYLLVENNYIKLHTKI